MFVAGKFADCGIRPRMSKKNPTPFFAKQPKAKRAFLSPYDAKKLRGRYGIRIELQPLRFPNALTPPENDAEVILDHLALASIVPKELQKTRFEPKAGRSPWTRYEGSCYFLGEHNWVDLNEIRFLEARGQSIRAEYDLVIHLPIPPPNEYPLVLSALTKAEPDKHKFVPRPPRHVRSIGTFSETHKDFWECQSTYHGFPITIQLHEERGSFKQVVAFAKSVIVDNAITPTDIHKHIQEHIGSLQWKFDYCKVRNRFKPEKFVPNWFSFYREDDGWRLAIRLIDPARTGEWILRFRGTAVFDLEWGPNT